MKSPEGLKASMKNLRRPPKGVDPGIRKPKGAVCFFTRLRAALMSDAPWQDASIETFKKKIRSGDAAFWRMFFDNVGPEAAQAAAQALGVTVNVSQSQTVALVAPDISSTDRLMELARLFAKIPALPEVNNADLPIHGQDSQAIQDVVRP